ncbi:hypothetical protein [uncultured Desulfuromonas sp.]|uniref:hypothetical protein n=1 Tax=uncultured Desulfuromonas sp. TaxID=181013 RepID=UPI002AAAFC71|nr:hypothetical protein [uncultured Desulfuromonas sp.]
MVKVQPLLEMVGNWHNFLSPLSEPEREMIQKHERTGRPLGKASFVEHLEQETGRMLRPQKPGPKKKKIEN